MEMITTCLECLAACNHHDGVDIKFCFNCGSNIVTQRKPFRDLMDRIKNDALHKWKGVGSNGATSTFIDESQNISKEQFDSLVRKNGKMKPTGKFKFNWDSELKKLLRKK